MAFVPPSLSVTPRSGARPSWSRRTRRAASCPGSSAQPFARGTKTRLTLSAAAISRSRRSDAAAPVRSMALTSRCAASHGASSAVRPVSTLTTPPGRSEVASTSLSDTAGSGRSCGGHDDGGVAGRDHRGEHRHEPEQGGVLRREHADHAGRLGQREREVRPGDRVRAARDLRVLVRPAGVVDPAVDRLVDQRRARRVPNRPRRPRPRRRTARGGPRASRRRGRGSGRGCRRSPSTSRRTPCGRRPPRPGRPCARPAQRARAARPSPCSPGTSDPTPNGGTPRRRRACTSCAPRPDQTSEIGLQTRAGRPRGRSPTPCSRRTARSGRSG